MTAESSGNDCAKQQQITPSRKRQKVWRLWGGFPASVVSKSFTLNPGFPFLPPSKRAHGSCGNHLVNARG
jgi:hypothetical protein